MFRLALKAGAVLFLFFVSLMALGVDYKNALLASLLGLALFIVGPRASAVVGAFLLFILLFSMVAEVAVKLSLDQNLAEFSKLLWFKAGFSSS